MANKRMFSLQIVDTDAFLDMPQSSQLLYFHLCMRADDEGFVGNPKKIMRVIGSSDDDYRVLIAKRFVLVFESSVMVIKHWLIHNTIRMDRFGGTTYQEERAQLSVKDNKSYTLATNGLPSGNRLEPQVKLSKVKLSKTDTMSASADAFDQFWNAYPKKELKKKTKELWSSKKLDTHLDVILNFIASAKNTDRWKKGYIKQPTVFLRNECWNDDLEAYNDKNIPSKKVDNVFVSKDQTYRNQVSEFIKNKTS